VKDSNQSQTTPKRLQWLRAVGEKNLLAIKSFSPKQRVFFVFFVATAILSGFGIVSLVNKSFMVSIPLPGGSLTEGIVGTPRFINPVLAISDADKDLVALTFSGLMRKSAEGELIPDLASGYDLSLDGREYTFTLKNGITWNDGKPLTADDVVFTIEKVQDASIRSPKKGSWEGIVAEKVDDRTIKFTLKQPYAPFIENTTIGILPKHIWSGLSAEQWGFSSYNVNPIGTGPFKVVKVQQNSYGIPEYYDLVPFDKFILGKPYIQNLRIKFYAGDDNLVAGYKAGEVESIAAISSEVASSLEKNGARVERTPLPRVFSVFFNQAEQPIFTSAGVRSALDIATNKEKIINEVLFGFATEAVGPLPHGVIGSRGINGNADVSTNTYPDESTRIQEAEAVLKKNGWARNEETGVMEKKVKKKPTETLSFTLTTSDAPELKQIANILKEDWEKIGARVEVKVFESGDLNENVIRTRKFNALLFGEIVGTDPDPYAFWHSSQRFDPGLNIALYANITTDKLLEKARETGDRQKRADLFAKFQTEVKKDNPAIFLYSPDFTYILPGGIQGLNLSGINISSERFSNIYEWYTRTQMVWKPFAK